ncbi:hypothetical protein [Methylobacterium sp. SI9]|uniref:hypothetical protein n=1 Tax=Methylobacterium guangdongense TaxID=3138811 RepID=UPI00313F04C5
MAKRYFFDLVYSRRMRPDGDDILLSDLGAAKRYGTRSLAEHVVAKTGERDKQLIMFVRLPVGGMLFQLSMEMHVEMAAAGRKVAHYKINAHTRRVRPIAGQPRIIIYVNFEK